MSLDFTQWGESMEMTENTIQTLQKEGFTTIRALKTLNDEEEYTVLDMFALSLGQKRPLKLAI